MGVLEAEHTGRIVAGGDANPRQQVAPRFRTTGTVAVRRRPAVVVPRREIDGNRLLTDIRTALDYFAVWPNDAALTTAVLWAAHAHGKDPASKLPIWQYSPRLFFTSAEGGSGKSWMARLVAKLSPDGKMLVESTKASLQRLLPSSARSWSPSWMSSWATGDATSGLRGWPTPDMSVTRQPTVSTTAKSWRSRSCARWSWTAWRP